MARKNSFLRAIRWAQEFSPDALQIKHLPRAVARRRSQGTNQDSRPQLLCSPRPITDLEFKRLLKQGRTSLFIGLVRVPRFHQGVVGP